eukprot:PITA_08516
MAKALWDKLGILYQSKSLVNKLLLRKKLYNLRMKDGDSVTEHLNAFNTVFDEIVSALLTEEMRWKNMDNQNGDALFVRGRSQNRNKNKSSSGDLNLEGDLNLQENLQRWCAGNAERKGTSEGSVNLKLLIKEGDLMILLLQRRKPPQMKVGMYGGDVFLGYDRKARIIGRGKVKLKLQGGRVRTLSGVLHIPALARNLISISKWMSRCKYRVRERIPARWFEEELVLMREFRVETLYKLQGSTVVDGAIVLWFLKMEQKI